MRCVDVVDPRHADERERPVDVAGRARRACARRRARPSAASAHEPRAPDEAGAGAERARLDDVLAAADASVEQDLRAVADRLDDGGEHVERRRRAVELAAAVVRDVDGVGPAADRLARRRAERGRP